MPPKRKGRVPSKTASIPSRDTAESVEEEPPIAIKTDTTQDAIQRQPWTDEQETSLFKAMIRWKPVGMHKHFRMIAISEHLKTHGCNGYALPQTAHTTIPGIWEKLGSLYNLEVLDFREDNIEDPKSDEAEEPFYEFALPDENYSDLTFARRLDPEAPSSPPLLPHQLSNTPIESGRAARRYSTVDDTDEPRSSPASTTRGTPTGRSTRASKNTRSSRLAEVSLPGGGGRQVSKAPGDQGTEEEVKGEDGGDDDGMDVDEDENKVTMHVDKGKASKGALGKVSKRRSGRNK